MVDITLAKLKYRNKDRRHLRRGSEFGEVGKPIDPYPDGTWVYNVGRFSAKTMNSGTPSKVIPLRPRRRAWGPW